VKGGFIMAIGVFLSPSSQPWNSCKMGDTEEQHMRKLAFKIKELFDKDSRFKCIVCEEFFSMTENQRLTRAVELSNNFYDQNGGNTWHIALHTDAFNNSATGFSCFYIGSGSGKTLAEKIKSNMANALKWVCRSIREYPELYELRKTKASAVLVENGFHDEINQAKEIHDNIDNGKLAMVYYKSICEAENLIPLTFDEVKKPDTVVSPVDGEQWKKDLVKEAIDLKLLYDTAWINKANESMPTFAVCAMVTRLYKLLKK
jgi:hypothetical protein